jgi:hypothetical protein
MTPRAPERFPWWGLTIFLLVMGLSAYGVWRRGF